MQAVSQHLTPTRLALALAAGLMLASPPGHGAVSVTGPYWLVPFDPVLLGPGNIDRPGSWLVIGTGSPGSFSVNAGSQVNVGGLALAGAGGSAAGLIDGVGSRVLLSSGPEFSRFDLAHYGNASLTISGGGALDGRANSSACASGNCYASVAGTAGSVGTLNITGVGSSASLLGSFHVAGTYVDTGFGIPGGQSQAFVNVTNGGSLLTDEATLGNTHLGPSSLGTERSFAQALISGSGAQWLVSGGTADGREAHFTMAHGGRSRAITTVSDGGLLQIQAAAGHNYNLRVGFGGEADLIVSGIGSRLLMDGDTTRGGLTVGEGGGGGVLSVLNGARLESTARWVNVGRDGGDGHFTIRGSGSAASFSSLAEIGIGSSGTGRLEVLGGANLAAAQLSVGREQGGNGVVVLDGSGSRVTLSGVDMERLYIGNGHVTVSNGAVLDGRANAAACPSGVWCGNLIGAHAGANGSLTVTGTGSTARFVGNFQAGIAGLGVQAVDGFTQGTPGGTAFGSLQILNGGLIEADRFSAGLGNYSLGSTGSESVYANLQINGPGSTMRLSGGDDAAIFQTVIWNAQNTFVNVAIGNGGKLQLQASTGLAAVLNLSSQGGWTDFKVSGAGSAVTLSSDTYRSVSIGNGGGTAQMIFSAGAQLSGVNYLTVGSNPGSQGRLSFDGAGTSGNLTGPVYIALGSRDARGALSISNGARLATDVGATNANLIVGGGASSTRGSGTLNIIGAGSTLLLAVSDSADGLFNPSATVGRYADGTVNITNGGQLLMQGGLQATAESYRMTGMTVGAGGVNSGNGVLNVSGAGSRLAVTGTNANLTIGAFAMGSGRLNASNGAEVVSTIMDIGNNGGIGSAGVDGASLRLSGQWAAVGANPALGARISIGAGVGSVGVLSLDHGALLQISNAGNADTALQLGGHSGLLGGSGVLNVSGGSTVTVSSAGGEGQVFIGRSGDGLATLSGGSILTADYVGVGAVLGADGGFGRLIVNDASVLSATTIEIGAKGYVGGTGTLVGNVINRGIFSPGNSPGTLFIDGSFINATGGRLVLEVESDGMGGFKTDQLIFAAGTAVDLGGLAVSFHFLGGTDPNAFQASGKFDIDSFLQVQGSDEGLDSSAFARVSFSARADAYTVTNFSFTADGGAAFTAAAVPEPGEWMMLLSGLAVVAWVSRRRKLKE